MAATKTGSLLLLNKDNTLLEMPVDGSTEPQPSSDRIEAGSVADYPELYFSFQGPGLPSVMLQTYFSNETGAIVDKPEASAADLLLHMI